MTDGNGNSRKIVTALLHEHEELVQLFIHEDSMAWNLLLTMLAANVAFLGATFPLRIFHQNGANLVAIGMILIFGLFVNLAGYFILQRSNIHRLSRLYRAYRIEKALQIEGHSVRTFRSAEGNIRDGRMLESPENDTMHPYEQKTRRLRRYEKIEVLNFRSLLWILAIINLVILVWVLTGRKLLTLIPG